MIKKCANCGVVRGSEECRTCTGVIDEIGYVNPTNYIPKHEHFCKNCGNSGLKCCNNCELVYIYGRARAVPRYFYEIMNYGTENDTKADSVNHPSHYQTNSGLETIQVIEAFTDGIEGVEAFGTANVIKYICRWKKKNGLQDLKKAQWYLEYLIEHVEKTDIDAVEEMGDINDDLNELKRWRDNTARDVKLHKLREACDLVFDAWEKWPNELINYHGDIVDFLKEKHKEEKESN